MLIAEIIVYAAFLYAALGAVFALWFVFYGASKLDDGARDSGFGFKIIIFAGAAALWIFLVPRLLKPKLHDGGKTARKLRETYEREQDS